jgi:hypothetical protein
MLTLLGQYCSQTSGFKSDYTLYPDGWIVGDWRSFGNS